MYKLLPVFIFPECRKCYLKSIWNENCPCVTKACFKNCFYGCVQVKFVIKNVELLMGLASEFEKS